MAKIDKTKAKINEIMEKYASEKQKYAKLIQSAEQELKSLSDKTSANFEQMSLEEYNENMRRMAELKIAIDFYEKQAGQIDNSKYIASGDSMKFKAELEQENDRIYNDALNRARVLVAELETLINDMSNEIASNEELLTVWNEKVDVFNSCETYTPYYRYRNQLKDWMQSNVMRGYFFTFMNRNMF